MLSDKYILVEQGSSEKVSSQVRFKILISCILAIKKDTYLYKIDKDSRLKI